MMWVVRAIGMTKERRQNQKKKEKSISSRCEVMRE